MLSLIYSDNKATLCNINRFSDDEREEGEGE
jgi:hypothetical protein